MRNIKKVFFSCFLSLLLFAVSCKKDPKSDKIEISEEVLDSTLVDSTAIVEIEKPVVKKKKKETKKKTTKKKTKTEIIAVPPGAPAFESVEARKYVRDYERYVANYKRAVEGNDLNAIIKLSDTGNGLIKQYKTVVSKLSKNELVKMNSYVESKSRQIKALAKKI